MALGFIRILKFLLILAILFLGIFSANYYFSSYLLWCFAPLFFILSFLEAKNKQNGPMFFGVSGFFRITLGIFILYLLFCLKNSIYLELGIVQFLNIVSLLLIGFSFSFNVLTKDTFLKYLFITGGIIAFYGLIQFISSDYWNYVRTYSVFYSHTALAGFLLPLILLLFFELLRDSAFKKNLYFLLFLFLLVLFFTYAKWAFISLSLFLALGIYLGRAKVTRNFLFRLGLVGLALITVIPVLTFWKINQAKKENAFLDYRLVRVYENTVASSRQQVARAEEETVPSVREGGMANDTMAVAPISPRSSWIFRVIYFNNTLKIIADNFWLGAGLGSFADTYKLYLEDVRDFAGSPHNIFLHIWSELGIVGLVMLVLLLSGVSRKVYEKYKQLAGEDQLKYLALIMASGLMIFSNLADNNFSSLLNLFLLSAFIGLLWGGERAGSNIKFFGIYLGLAGILLCSGFFNLMSDKNSASFFKFWRGDYYFALAKENLAGNEADFLSNISRALFFDRTNYIYRDYLGKFYLSKNQLSSAKDEFRKNIFLNPAGMPNLYVPYLQLLSSQKEWREIVNFTNLVLPYYPISVMDSGDWQTVTKTEDRKKAIRDIYLLRGEAFSQLGEKDKALVALDTAELYR